jgi:hypothetical protein
VLTWPEGLQAIVTKLCDRVGGLQVGRAWRQPGTAIRITEGHGGVDVLCASWPNGVGKPPRSFLLRARRVICAAPLAVSARLLPLARWGFEPLRDQPKLAAWLVANFHLQGRPPERTGAPLSWDNVIYGSAGLGYVVSTHQWIRQAVPAETVFTAYYALADRSPAEARRWMLQASPRELMAHASADLEAAYGSRFWYHVKSVEITLRAHAMATPAPGFLENAGTAALREADGAIVFAHADLSGMSIFEEAAGGVRGLHCVSSVETHAEACEPQSDPAETRRFKRALPNAMPHRCAVETYFGGVCTFGSCSEPLPLPRSGPRMASMSGW